MLGSRNQKFEFASFSLTISCTVSIQSMTDENLIGARLRRTMPSGDRVILLSSMSAFKD
jgi:hypothetical protein